MIRCINQLERHQEGEIRIRGAEVDDNLERLNAVRMEVGMVFQHFNLFRT